jgi:hypothetical protein
MNDVVRGLNGRFLPGNPGGGRPIGSRNKLAGAVLDTFLADFQVHGADALVRMREERPGDYWRVAVQLLPNEVLISAMVTTETSSPFADMSPEQKRAIAQRIYRDIEADAKVIEAAEIDGNATPMLPQHGRDIEK